MTQQSEWMSAPLRSSTDKIKRGMTQLEYRDMPTGNIPDNCQSCGATLVDVPFKGKNCPHCGHDVVTNPPHFGAEQWDQISPRHRDRDPEVHMSRTPQPSD